MKAPLVSATTIADPVSPILPMNITDFEGGQRQGFYSLSFASPRLEKKGGGREFPRGLQRHLKILPWQNLRHKLFERG